MRLGEMSSITGVVGYDLSVCRSNPSKSFFLFGLLYSPAYLSDFNWLPSVRLSKLRLMSSSCSEGKESNFELCFFFKCFLNPITSSTRLISENSMSDMTSIMLPLRKFVKLMFAIESLYCSFRFLSGTPFFGTLVASSLWSSSSSWLNFGCRLLFCLSSLFLYSFDLLYLL